MPSCLTDEVRMKHYEKCLFKKRRCESVLGFCMKVVLLIAIFTIIPAAFEGLLYGLFIGNLEPFLRFLLQAFAGAVTIYCIYLRNWKITVVAVFLSALMSPFVPPIIVVCLFAHYKLNKLAQEPGWPLFTITYGEQQERQKNMERIARHKSLQLGEAAASHGSTDMDDLLDEHPPMLPTAVVGYHDRFRNSDPHAQSASVAPGIMPTLEDIGGTPQTTASCTPHDGEQIQ